MMMNEYKKSSKVFYNISKYYNYWKVRKITPLQKMSSKYEFGVDEYIRAKASYAESLMNVGQV